MMPIYAVMMRHAGHTWIDSLWVEEFSFLSGAEKRVDDMKRMHEALKLDTAVWIVEMTIQDGTTDPKVAADPKPTAHPIPPTSPV